MAPRGNMLSGVEGLGRSPAVRPLVLAFLLLATLPAHASIIELDYEFPRDRRIQRDTSTGLDWLKTLGIYDEIIAGAGGYLEDGWRYATEAEVCALAIGLNCPGFTSSGNLFDPDIPSRPGFGIIYPLLAGGNHLPPSEGQIRFGIFDGGAIRGTNFSSRDVPVAERTLEIGFGAEPFRTQEIGQLLVRPFVPIPEPGTAALVALGLACLATGRRSRRSSR